MAAEKPAASRKKIDRPIRIPVSPGSRKSSPNTTAAKSTRVRNIRLRYAAAPSWTAWAISCIRGVPSCAASTCRRRTTAKASEATAMTAITLTATRLEVPSEGIRPPMRRCRHGIAAAGARPPVPQKGRSLRATRGGNVAGPGGGRPTPVPDWLTDPNVSRPSGVMLSEGGRTRGSDPPSPTRRMNHGRLGAVPPGAGQHPRHGARRDWPGGPTWSGGVLVDTARCTAGTASVPGPDEYTLLVRSVTQAAAEPGGEALPLSLILAPVTFRVYDFEDPDSQGPVTWTSAGPTS